MSVKRVVSGWGSLFLAAVLFCVPFVPGGCQSESIKSSPDYLGAVADLSGVRDITVDGIQPGEKEALAVLLADFNQRVARLQGRLDSAVSEVQDSVKRGVDTVAPFVPPPWNVLLPPLGTLAAALWLIVRGDRKHAASVEELRAQLDELTKKTPA